MVSGRVMINIKAILKKKCLILDDEGVCSDSHVISDRDDSFIDYGSQ